MTQEKAVEELIYELGAVAVPLKNMARDFDYLGVKTVRDQYELFKSRALKLGVGLPDFTEDNMSGPFLAYQIVKVERYIDLHKTVSMIELYRVAEVAETFLLHLLMPFVAKSIEDPAKKVGSRNTVQLAQDLSKLIKSAKELGVVIDDQLEGELQKYIYDKPMQSYKDLESVSIKLQKVICGLRFEVSSNPIKRSEVDRTRGITDECWTVSLARLPDRSNAEHAFIVLEGKSGRKSKIWFADFVAVHWFDVVCPTGTQDGKVRMEYHESEGITGPESRLLFKCQKKMMDVRASDRLLSSSWQITKTTAENLIHTIVEHQKNPPKYHILGKTSVLAGSSASSSSNPTGHNCFTFATMILRDLNDESIELPQDRLETWIGAATSRFLVEKQSRKWYRESWSQLMFAIAIAGVVFALLFKAFYLKK